MFVLVYCYLSGLFVCCCCCFFCLPENFEDFALDHLLGTGDTLQHQQLFLVEGLLLLMMAIEELLS